MRRPAAHLAPELEDLVHCLIQVLLVTVTAGMAEEVARYSAWAYKGASWLHVRIESGWGSTCIAGVPVDHD